MKIFDLSSMLINFCLSSSKFWNSEVFDKAKRLLNWQLALTHNQQTGTLNNTLLNQPLIKKTAFEIFAEYRILQ